MPWWATLLIILGTWASAIVAIALYVHRLHVESNEHRDRFKEEMKSSITGLRQQIEVEKNALLEKMRTDHQGMSAQISDMNRTVGQEFVRQQEFQASHRSLSAAITDARKDVGIVGNKVDDLGKRIDRLYEHYAWPTRRTE